MTRHYDRRSRELLAIILFCAVVALVQACASGGYHPQPNPTPTPVSPTTTTMPRPPVAQGCPLQPGQLAYEVKLSVHKYGDTAQQWEATPYITSAATGGDPHPIPPSNWTGTCEKWKCDLAPEKDTTNGYDCSMRLCGTSIVYALEDDQGNPQDKNVGFINWTADYKAKVTGSGVLRGTCPVSGGSGTVRIP